MQVPPVTLFGRGTPRAPCSPGSASPQKWRTGTQTKPAGSLNRFSWGCSMDWDCAFDNERWEVFLGLVAATAAICYLVLVVYVLMGG